MIACPSVVKLCGCILNGWMSSILSVVVYHLSLITTYTSGRCYWVQLRSCVFFRVVFSSNMALWCEIQVQRFGMETMKPTLKKMRYSRMTLALPGGGWWRGTNLGSFAFSFDPLLWAGCLEKAVDMCLLAANPTIKIRWKPAGTFWKLYHHSVFWRMHRSSVNVNMFMIFHAPPYIS